MRNVLNDLKKFNIRAGSIIKIPYIALNDEKDTKTPNDPNNKIEEAFFKKKLKEQEQILDNLFHPYKFKNNSIKTHNNYIEGIVFIDGKSYDIQIKEVINPEHFIEIKVIDDRKNVKKTISIGTSKTVKKFYNTPSHKELMSLVNRARDKKDLEHIKEVIDNILNTL